MSDLPKRVVDKMMEQDPFSAWMGMELIEIGKGHCTLQMTVRKEMLNGFAKAHGAITYALLPGFCCQQLRRTSPFH